MAKKDPYAALRFKEFNIFLLLRFLLVFAWSMQFIIIEWQVYSLTKDPLSLGIIGLMEIIPALSMALFAGHIVDQREKRNLFLWCIGLVLAILMKPLRSQKQAFGLKIIMMVLIRTPKPILFQWPKVMCLGLWAKPLRRGI